MLVGLGFLSFRDIPPPARFAGRGSLTAQVFSQIIYFLKLKIGNDRRDGRVETHADHRNIAVDDKHGGIDRANRATNMIRKILNHCACT